MRTQAMSDIKNIEMSITQAKAAIAASTSLQTLVRSKHFKEIILEGYFEKEASRLVLLRAEPSMQDEVSRKVIDDQITAIGYLRQYFITIKQLGRMSEKALKDDEAELESILAEEL